MFRRYRNVYDGPPVVAADERVEEVLAHLAAHGVVLRAGNSRRQGGKFGAYTLADASKFEASCFDPKPPRKPDPEAEANLAISLDDARGGSVLFGGPPQPEEEDPAPAPAPVPAFSDRTAAMLARAISRLARHAREIGQEQERSTAAIVRLARAVEAVGDAQRRQIAQLGCLPRIAQALEARTQVTRRVLLEAPEAVVLADLMTAPRPHSVTTPVPTVTNGTGLLPIRE